MWWLLENRQVTGLLNIGTGKAHSWNQLATATFKALKKTPKINYIEMPEQLKNQYQYFTEANMKKPQLLNLPTQCSPLEDSVHDYINQYLLSHQYLQ